MFLAHVVLGLALGVRAQDVPADHQTFTLLGWNKACSVAIAHYTYPKIAYAIADEPVVTRLGTLTIEPGEENPKTRWEVALDGKMTWDPALAAKAKEKLAKEGYTLAGYREIIRAAPVVDARDLPRLLLSTDTFKSKTTQAYPDPEQYRLAEVYYAPFASCGLLLYRDTHQRTDFYKTMLIRIETPLIRQDRALSHIDNGLLLLEQGDRLGAVAETAIAAQMDPSYAEARYKHAAMLNLNGQTDDAVEELTAAIQLDPSLRAKAKTDEDFDSLKGFPRFDDLMNEK